MCTQIEYVGNQSLQEVLEAVIRSLLRSRVITVDFNKLDTSPPNLEDIITKND
jgi:hypothetical protein